MLSSLTHRFDDLGLYSSIVFHLLHHKTFKLINRYKIYKEDIEQLGFKLPYVDDCILSDELVEEGYKILTDIQYRNEIVKHNLQVLREKLDHKIIADMLEPLILKMFTRILIKHDVERMRSRCFCCCALIGSRRGVHRLEILF